MDIQNVFKKDSIFTVITISDWMASTVKETYKAVGVEHNGLPVLKFAKNGTRKTFTIPKMFDKGTMIFAGEVPFKIDSEMEVKNGISIIRMVRGNACYNFCGNPTVIKEYVRTKNLNENFSNFDAVLWIDGEKEFPLFPDVPTSHAVVMRIRDNMVPSDPAIKESISKIKNMIETMYGDKGETSSNQTSIT